MKKLVITMGDPGGVGPEIIAQALPKKKPTAAGGSACVGYIRKAVELAMNKQVDGMVTAPISKEALKMAGFAWPGHTEMLAEFSRTKQYAMMLEGGPLRVILAP